MSGKVMNLPNKITIFRVFLIPVYLFFALRQTSTSYFIALAIFVVASLSDSLDGYIARKYNLVTNFGKLMDPLADKLLVSAAFITFIDIGAASSVAVFLILAREFIVTSIRLLALESEEKRVIAANFWGKLKTIIQMVAISLILFLLAINSPKAILISNILVWICAAITVISGATYVYEGRELFTQ